IGLRNRDARLADHHAARQPLRDLVPRAPAVGGSEDAALEALAAGVDRPRLALDGPHRSEQVARVLRVHREVDGAGPVADLQHLLPRPAAVLRPVDATLRVRPEDVAEDGEEGDVRIAGVNRDAADEAGLLEADLRPRLAGVDRLVGAVAVGDVAARVG